MCVETVQMCLKLGKVNLNIARLCSKMLMITTRLQLFLSIGDYTFNTPLFVPSTVVVSSVSPIVRMKFLVKFRFAGKHWY